MENPVHTDCCGQVRSCYNPSLHLDEVSGNMRTEPTVVAVAQINPKLGDLDHNIALHREKALQAAELGAELVIFPEMSLTGYLLKDLTQDVAQNTARSEYLNALAELSRDIALLVGFVEEGDDYIFYNSAGYFEDGEIKHVHRKVYLPTYGMFDEERYFSPGGTFKAFETKFGRAAVLICEDYWHPSSIYLAAQDGAVLHFYMANAPLRGLTLPDEITSVDIAETMANVSSQLYGVYSVYANRVGYEDGICFGGGSKIVSPTAGVLARAGRENDEILLAEIEAEQVRRARTMFPLLGDEKIDMVYRELERIRKRKFESEEKK